MPSLKVLCVTLLCLGSCRKAPTIPVHGLLMENLPTATNAPLFSPAKQSFTEALFENGHWKIFHNGQLLQPDLLNDEEYGRFKAAREQSITQGNTPALLISAPGETRFREIRNIVREAARAGFSDIWFLASNFTSKPETGAFHLALPLADGGKERPQIEPFFIQITSENIIYTGTGSSRALLDRDAADHSLPKLNQQLELYAAAARAANCSVVLQVHVDPESTYQRLIDLMSRFHAHQITHIMFIDIDDVASSTCEGMNFERNKRLEHLKTKAAIPPSAPARQNK